MTAGSDLARLRGRWPGWHIWHVPCFPDPGKWCAERPGDTSHATHIQEHSPDTLEMALMLAEEGP